MKFNALLNWYEATRSQLLMYLLFYMAAVSALFGGIAAVQDGKWPLLAIGMHVLAIGITALLRLWPERSLDHTFLNPKVMSSAFLYGGGVVLPVALWFAGRGRSNTVLTDSEEAWMILGSLVVGLVAMGMFYRVDSLRYIEAGWKDALLSPSKVWINFVIVPVSSAMFMWLMAPQIVLLVLEPSRAGAVGDTFIASLLMAGFVGLVAYDAMYPPDPTRQHIRWNARTYRRADAVTI